jgi:peptidoglycan/xylan/chitin deacetylase (PgdA/CDA1 family)
VFDIPIIMFHSVNDHPAENPLGFLSISPSEFDAQLRALTRAGFQFTTMKALCEMAQSDDLGNDPWIVLTFDDGYLDNLLHAKPVLEANGARATVYVSPDFVGPGKVRTLAEVANGWGYLNWEELRLLEKSGVFDVQSHTLTHDHVFWGSRVVDVYTSQKFKDYYWLTHLLAPATKREWQGDVSHFASTVPDGYPVFEHGRALGGPQFIPAPDFVNDCLAAFDNGGQDAVLRLASTRREKGVFESSEAFHARLHREIADSKQLIENRLGKRVDTVCFPGGVYNEIVLEHTARAGYRIFFRASKEPARNNRDALPALSVRFQPPSLVGLSRISFTRDYPRRYFRRAAAFWNVTLKMRHFMRPGEAQPVFRIFRGVRNALRRAGVV